MKSKFYPGWKMTWDQRNAYFKLIDAAAKASGARTAKEREDLRQQIHQRAFRGPKSAKDINHLNDFDELKAACLAITQPTNLNAQMRQAEMPTTRARTAILALAPLALINHFLATRFKFAVWLRKNYPAMEGKTISKGTAAKPARNPAPDWVVQEYRDAAPAAPALEDLNDAELNQLRNTLAREASSIRGSQPKTLREAEQVEVGNTNGDPDWNV